MRAQGLGWPLALLENISRWSPSEKNKGNHSNILNANPVVIAGTNDWDYGRVSHYHHVEFLL